MTGSFLALVGALAYRRRRLRQERKDANEILSKFPISNCMIDLRNADQSVLDRLQKRKMIYRVGDSASTWYSLTNPNGLRS